MTNLEQRAINYSHEHGLTHIGSVLTVLPIIDNIYRFKNPKDKFVLSSGHAHLAHAIIKEKYGEGNLDDMMKAGIHCDVKNGCDVSTGSLGMGLPIAVGLALADKSRRVYCVISDGECNEGSVWEALRIAGEKGVTNLRVYCNANGWSAYDKVDVDLLERRLHLFFPVNVVRTQISEAVLQRYPQLQGLGGHYATV